MAFFSVSVDLEIVVDSDDLPRKDHGFGTICAKGQYVRFVRIDWQIRKSECEKVKEKGG